jgi:hypothetical protein
MSRKPEFGKEDFDRAKDFIQGVGHDAAKLQGLPHGTERTNGAGQGVGLSTNLACVLVFPDYR